MFYRIARLTNVSEFSKRLYNTTHMLRNINPALPENIEGKTYTPIRYEVMNEGFLSHGCMLKF